MLSVPDLTDVIKAAPMPLFVKEQILDQVLGHHDDLRPTDHLPGRKTLRPAPTPLAVRVAQAGRDGGFTCAGVEENGDERWLYSKRGEPAYVVLVRDGQPVNCGCTDFRIQSLRQPDYSCKHMALWLRMEAGVTDDDLATEALVEASAAAEAEGTRRYAAYRLCPTPKTEAAFRAAHRAAQAAREAMDAALPAAEGFVYVPIVWPSFDEAVDALLAQQANAAREAA